MEFIPSFPMCGSFKKVLDRRTVCPQWLDVSCDSTCSKLSWKLWMRWRPLWRCELLLDSQQLLSALVALWQSFEEENVTFFFPLSHKVTGCLISFLKKGPLQSEPHAYADTQEDCVSSTSPPTRHTHLHPPWRCKDFTTERRASANKRKRDDRGGSGVVTLFVFIISARYRNSTGSKQHISFIKKKKEKRQTHNSHRTPTPLPSNKGDKDGGKYAHGNTEEIHKTQRGWQKIKRPQKKVAADVWLQRRRALDDDITSPSATVPLLWVGKHQRPTSRCETPLSKCLCSSVSHTRHSHTDK